MHESPLRPATPWRDLCCETCCNAAPKPGCDGNNPLGLFSYQQRCGPFERQTERDIHGLVTTSSSHLPRLGNGLPPPGDLFGVEMSTAIAAWGQNLGVLACVHLHLSYAEVISFSLALTLICQLQQSLFVAKSIMFNCVITRHFSTR